VIEILHPPGCKIIHDGNGHVMRQQGVDQMATDEAGAPGDDRPP
jgi:hypothetical protein